MNLIRITALCAVLLSSSLAVAQEGGGMPPVGAPAEMESLSFQLGEWDVAMFVRMSPEAEWMESAGSATMELELDGCVLVTHFQAEVMGMPFKGKDSMTYNRETKQFESFWVDSMSANFTSTHGNWDGDSLVMKGEASNMGVKHHNRMTTTKVSDTEMNFVMEMSMDGENYFESMKMTYKKKG